MTLTQLAPAGFSAAATPGPPVFDWAGFKPFPAYFLGVAAFDASDADRVRTYLNWDALFRKWEIPVSFPSALDDADWGETARTLLRDANTLLNDWLAGGKLWAEVVYGVWRAGAEGDQVVVQPGDTTPDTRTPDARTPDARTPVRLSFPRLPPAPVGPPKRHHPDGPTYCVADFIKPAAALMAGESDYIGGYAIRLGRVAGDLIGELAAGHDEYRRLLATDLLALYRSAVEDYLHYRLRRFIWAYCDDDDLSNEEVLTGQQQGIRIEMGGLECPDWAEQPKLLHLLGIGEWPAGRSPDGTDSRSSVGCGYFFAHPCSRNFASESTGREWTSPV